jgi:hypothetical protein
VLSPAVEPVSRGWECRITGEFTLFEAKLLARPKQRLFFQ